MAQITKKKSRTVTLLIYKRLLVEFSHQKNQLGNRNGYCRNGQQKKIYPLTPRKGVFFYKKKRSRCYHTPAPLT